jgi:hypothetical protein
MLRLRGLPSDWWNYSIFDPESQSPGKFSRQNRQTSKLCPVLVGGFGRGFGRAGREVRRTEPGSDDAGAGEDDLCLT